MLVWQLHLGYVVLQHAWPAFGHLMLHPDNCAACPVAAALREQGAGFWEGKRTEDDRLPEGLCLQAGNICTAEPRLRLQCAVQLFKSYIGPSQSSHRRHELLWHD